MTIFVDVTHTLATGAATGIQRAVRELARQLVKRDDIVLVAARDDRFYPLGKHGQTELLQPSTRGGATNPSDRRAGSILLTIPVLFERLQAWNFNRRIRGKIATMTELCACRPQHADLVILLDAFWGGASVPAAADAARQAGAKIVAIIYDMIPVTHPKFMEAATVAVFAPRVRRVLKQSDAVVTISGACATSVQAFAGKRAPPIRHFYLGGDFARPASPSGDVGHARRFVLVGTVEPRKGHAMVLDCFDRLWEKGEDVELIFVGRPGWGDPELIARCRNHPQRGVRFHHREDADDAELVKILASADATIVASAVEGFGLPLIESLVQGVPVLASDIAVFREVGGDAALYFMPDNVNDLERAVRQFRSNPQPWRRRAAAFEWINWNASADMLIGAIEAALGTARHIVVPSVHA